MPRSRVACLAAASYIRDLWPATGSQVPAPSSSERWRLILVEPRLAAGAALATGLRDATGGEDGDVGGTMGRVGRRVLGELPSAARGGTPPGVCRRLGRELFQCSALRELL